MAGLRCVFCGTALAAAGCVWVRLNVYLPEDWYFVDESGPRPSAGDVPVARAAYATVKPVARWADSYWAARSFSRAETREGPIPADPAALDPCGVRVFGHRSANAIG